MILLASGNAHKLQEISQILGVPLRGLSDVPDAPDVVEDGNTFEANAIKKGASLAAHTGSWTLADDSGLEVDALDGAPGVHSARFAGEHGNDAANNALLLEKLKNVQNRQARFVCVLALCGPEGEALTVRGTCEGRIAHAPSGKSGFGYDPLFIPDGFDKSFAELGEEIKQTHSHRAKALEKMKREFGDHPAFSGSLT
ncbi:MAG: RdgB/HAM1 family non-canonical purine NTP pyrophosphatase [Verrucomicrobia bacterium]|nr:RdgB/HAM1 family non-canonical purine NTP pyrophosphatase [Verrucomicrobiota bacterium]MCH8512876.1 RdgB/HAM1 family non-canonical purine NTP pyrophosphatase [Kiritimatiellia bacterium]